MSFIADVILIRNACGPGWIKPEMKLHTKFSDCYRILENVPYNWYEAYRMCKEMDANLLDIENVKELEFIRDFVLIETTKWNTINLWWLGAQNTFLSRC